MTTSTTSSPVFFSATSPVAASEVRAKMYLRVADQIGYLVARFDRLADDSPETYSFFSETVLTLSKAHDAVAAAMTEECPRMAQIHLARAFGIVARVMPTMSRPAYEDRAHASRMLP